jgi:hypothetical protein
MRTKFLLLIHNSFASDTLLRGGEFPNFFNLNKFVISVSGFAILLVLMILLFFWTDRSDYTVHRLGVHAVEVIETPDPSVEVDEDEIRIENLSVSLQCRTRISSTVLTYYASDLSTGREFVFNDSDFVELCVIVRNGNIPLKYSTIRTIPVGKNLKIQINNSKSISIKFKFQSELIWK